MENKKDILSKYPKERIELPPAYREIYAEHYLINREGKSATTSLSKRLEYWLHRQVAKDSLSSDQTLETLEIGAGTLNQPSFEKSSGRYDIIEPFRELFEDSPLLSRVDTVFADISEIDPSDRKYDRITSIAVFEHIPNLPVVVAQAALLLKKGGCLRTAIPNEGTVMWYLGTLFTGLGFKKRYGLDYQVLMKYEHVNTSDDIERVLDYFLERKKRSVCGLNKYLAFYRFYEHVNPKIDKARRFLETHFDKNLASDHGSE